MIKLFKKVCFGLRERARKRTEVRKQHGVRHSFSAYRYFLSRQPPSVDDPEETRRQVQNLQAVLRFGSMLWDKRQKRKAGVTVKQHVRKGKIIQEHKRKWPD